MLQLRRQRHGQLDLLRRHKPRDRAAAQLDRHLDGRLWEERLAIARAPGGAAAAIRRLWGVLRGRAVMCRPLVSDSSSTTIHNSSPIHQTIRGWCWGSMGAEIILQIPAEDSYFHEYIY